MTIVVNFLHLAWESWIKLKTWYIKRKLIKTKKMPKVTNIKKTTDFTVHSQPTNVTVSNKSEVGVSPSQQLI